MKKIKSVRLKNDYRTAYYFLAKGSLLKFNNNTTDWCSELGHVYSEEEIRDCKTDLFEIEYEEERKYIDVRIEFENGIKLYGNDFSAKGLESYLTNSYTNSNTNKGQVKVTELPELFTRRDICEIFRGCFATQDYILTLINNFLERSSK